jgi:hypothetical protein
MFIKLMFSEYSTNLLILLLLFRPLNASDSILTYADVDYSRTH